MNKSLFPNANNQPMQEEPINGQRVFWGAIIFTIVALISFVFSFFLILRSPVWQTYAISIITAVALIADTIGMVNIVRGRAALGLKYFYWSLLLTVPPNVLLVTSTTTFLIGIILVAGFTQVLYLQPRAWRRNYQYGPIVASVIMALVELFQPSFRLVVTNAGTPSYFGPVILAFLILSLFSLGALQAWNRNNIRSRFLTLSLSLTLVAAVVIAVISVSSLLSAGENAQETSAQVLRGQVQETLKHQTSETALKNDLVLQNISQDAQDVAQQAAQILGNPNAFNAGSLWEADDHMFVGPNGQYINGEGDTSTVFVPNTVTVDDNFKEHLELLAYLDMVFVPVYEDNPNAVAIYFVGSNEISWYYPNISLGSLVPPDYLATQDIFYTIGSPSNNPNRQVVWTPVYDDPGGQGLLVSAIAPIYSRGKFMGVIGIDVSLANLTKSVETEDFGAGEGSYAILLDQEGRALALPEQGYKDILGREREPNEFGTNLISSAREEFSPVLADALTGTTGFQDITAGDKEFFVAYSPLESTRWILASVVNASQVLAPATTLQTELEQSSRVLVFQRVLPVGIAILVLVVVVGFFFTNRLVNPIEQLTVGAAKIGTGEWDTPLPQSELQEISGLSHTLSTMAAQLKNTLGTLEQRVADRTRNLELAAEVGRAVSQVRDLDVMLKDSCDLILKEFNLYYVQVYLTDASGSKLKLEAGTGNVGAELAGRGHSLSLDTGSINGRAAVEKRSVVISDTAQSPTFRPNVLLPDTRGEMAVPLIVADKVVGVLDMQSSAPGVLSEEVLPAFEALAGQLAVAIQNANLLAETEQARAQVEAQARRLVRQGWNEHLDAIHKPEQLGFVFDHDNVAPFAEEDEMQSPEDGKTVSAPIAVTGEALGSLVVELDDEARAEQTSELVNIVARQVAQQIENLRLLESAERYRNEAEQAVRRQTRENWQDFFKSGASQKLGYLYDLNEVRPHNTDDEMKEGAYTAPLKVRDEAIGKLAIEGIEADDDTASLVNTVADRLTAHIEGLRQSSQTQSALAQSEKLFNASRNLTQTTNLQDMVNTAVTTLNIPAINRAILVSFDYDRSGEIEGLDVIANWWNGTGHQATEVGTHYPLEVIRVMPMFVSPTPVFFNDSFTDERVDATTMQLVQRLNLRAVAVLPLYVGTTQLGALILEAEVPHNFSVEETRLFTAIAPQVATIVDNRRQFERAQKQAEREAMLNIINQKIQSATSVESVLQIAARELGHALGAPMTVAQLSMKDGSS